jgi:hypothetical protein
LPETKFHIQKYVELENIEKRSRLLEVTLGSSTHTNLGHTAVIILKKKNVWGKVRCFQIIFSVEIVGPCYFLTSFAALARREEPRTVVVKTKIGKDPLINKFLFHNNTVLLSPKEILNLLPFVLLANLPKTAGTRPTYQAEYTAFEIQIWM